MTSTSKDPLVLRDKITRALQIGDFTKALSFGQRMIKLPMASVQDCMAVSEMGQRLADAQTSVLGARAAYKRAPRDLRLLFEVANVELRSGFTKEALTHMKHAAALCEKAEDFDDLGNHYGRMDEAQLAHEAFSKAHEMAPDSLQSLSNLAVSFGFLGHAEEAEKLYDQAIAKGNKDEFTYLNRSSLRKQTEERNHIPELKMAIEELPDGGEGAPFLIFALSKELEDVGRNEESFDVLEIAAAARRKQVDFSQENDTKEIDEIIDTYNTSVFENEGRGCLSKEPIFVLGMPRSGTTLVERIISSHSQVFAAGELGNLNRIVRLKTSEAARAAGRQNFQPLEMSLKTDMKKMGEAYVLSTRPRTGHTAHFIDKQPTNFIFCGLIERALPNAKIVHMRRHPMDACYAVLKQPFREGYYFSYDQRELATSYLSYLKLMDHWDTVMPGRIIHVRYEELVTDVGAVTRDLIQRLGLEWEDACLDHAANPAPSVTASAAQVRQPIYTSSIGKWRHFERQLAPLKEALEAGGLDVS